MPKSPRKTVPEGMSNFLQRLFGRTARLCQREAMTESQWRGALTRILDHLYGYLKENVRTDDLHFLMLCTGLAAARESLEKDEDFWPGYVEGISRLALLLMGDLPDHRKTRPGSRKKDHFALNKFRTLHYTQDANQKLWTLVGAYKFRFPEFEGNPFHALDEFRAEYGFKPSLEDFIAWYKKRYPKNYALLF